MEVVCAPPDHLHQKRYRRWPRMRAAYHASFLNFRAGVVRTAVGYLVAVTRALLGVSRHPTLNATVVLSLPRNPADRERHDDWHIPEDVV